MFRLSQIAVGFYNARSGKLFHLSGVESFLICCGTVEGIVNFGDLFEIYEAGGEKYGRKSEPQNSANNAEKNPQT